MQSDKSVREPDSWTQLPIGSRKLIDALWLAGSGLLHGFIKLFTWYKPATFTILQPRVLL